MSYQDTKSDSSVPSDRGLAKRCLGLRRKYRLSRVSFNMAQRDRNKRRIAWRQSLSFGRENNISSVSDGKKGTTDASDKIALSHSDMSCTADTNMAHKNDRALPIIENAEVNDESEELGKKNSSEHIAGRTDTDSLDEEEYSIIDHAQYIKNAEESEDDDADGEYIVIDEVDSMVIDTESDENVIPELTNTLVRPPVKESTNTNVSSDIVVTETDVIVADRPLKSLSPTNMTMETSKYDLESTEETFTVVDETEVDDKNLQIEKIFYSCTDIPTACKKIQSNNDENLQVEKTFNTGTDIPMVGKEMQSKNDDKNLQMKKISFDSCTVSPVYICKESDNECTEKVVEKEISPDVDDVIMPANDKQQKGEMTAMNDSLADKNNSSLIISTVLHEDKAVLDQDSVGNARLDIDTTMEIGEVSIQSKSESDFIDSGNNDSTYDSSISTNFVLDENENSKAESESQTLSNVEGEIIDNSSVSIESTENKLLDAISNPEEEICCLLERISDVQNSDIAKEHQVYDKLNDKCAAEIMNVYVPSKGSIDDKKCDDVLEIVSDPEEEIDSLLEGISSDEGTNSDEKINSSNIKCAVNGNNDHGKDIQMSKSKTCKLSEIVSDPEEEIDSLLEGISSDDDSELIPSKNSTEMYESSSKTSCKFEADHILGSSSSIIIEKNSGPSDTNQMTAANSHSLMFLINKISSNDRAKSESSEDIDMALEGIDTEDGERYEDELFDDGPDDGSIKDGIDIESVLLDNDEEMDSIVDKIPDEKFGIADSKNADKIIKMKNLEIIDDCTKKEVIGLENYVDGKFSQKNILLPLEKQVRQDECLLSKPEDKVDLIDKEVRSVLHVLCNIVSLQADQVLTFERIAVMESVLHKTGNDNESSSESIEKGLQTISSDNCTENISTDISISSCIGKYSSGDFDEVGNPKKRLAFDISSDIKNNNSVRPFHGLHILSVSTESGETLSDEEKNYCKNDDQRDSIKDDSTKVKDPLGAIENSRNSNTDKKGNITMCSIGTVFMAKDGLFLLNSNSSESRKSDGVKSDTTPVTQTSNENSSDSEKSAIKFEENVENIIQSLSSPKPDVDFNTKDSCSVIAEDESEKNLGNSKENVTLEDADINEFEQSNNNSAVGSIMVISSYSLDGSETKDTASLMTTQSNKRKATDELNSSKRSKSEVDAITDSLGSKMLNGGLFARNFISQQNSVVKEVVSINENEMKIMEDNDCGAGYVEVQHSNLKSFMRVKVHEYCMSKYGNMIQSLQEQKAKLKQDLLEQNKRTETVQQKMRDLAKQQTIIFHKYSYNPKVEKRTVGVNVRIMLQPDVRARTYSNMYKGNATVQTTPSVSAPRSATGSINTRIISPSTLTPTTTTGSARMPVQLLVPRTSPLSNNILTFAATQPASSSSTPAAPCTPAPSLMLLTNNSTSTPPLKQHQVVDLTDDDLPVHKSGSSNSVARAGGSSQTPTKSPNVMHQMPMPLMAPVMQLLPAGTTIASTPSDLHAIRNRPPVAMSQTPRLPWTLPVLHSMGGSPPRIVNVTSPPGASNMRQPLQTFVLAPMSSVMTTSGQVASTSRSTPIDSNATPQAQTTITPALGPNSQVTLTRCFARHPAPLPPSPSYVQNLKLKALPPKPSLKMSKVSNGIVLSWNMNITAKHAEISSYQLYAYQENPGPVSPFLWKKVGDIKALPLPMACTLTQFVEGHKYHFTVRAIDEHKRAGPFSEAASILLFSRKNGEPPSN